MKPNAANDHESTHSDDTIAVQKFQPTWDFYFAFACLFVIIFAASLSSTSLSLALPTIANDLVLDTTQGFWLVSSATVSSTVVQPSCACLADILGRKGALAASVAFLALGSAIAAVAQSFVVILVGRCLQGLGLGAVTAITEIIVVEMVPLRLRGKWLSFISISWALGTVTGPIVGGLLAQQGTWTWRLIFALITPISLIGLIMCLFTLELPHTSAISTKDQLRALDWFGLVLFTVSLTLTLVATLQGGLVYAWDDWRIVVPMSLGLAGLVVFIVYELTFAKNPIIPKAIFTNRSSSTAFTLTALHGYLLWLALYYLPLYYQAVKLFTPLAAAVAMLPETASIVPASAIAGLVITWSGRYRVPIWIGWLVTASGLFALRYLDANTPTYGWIGLNLIFGLGTGILFGAMGFAVQASVPSDVLPVAVSMFSFFRSMGAAIGVSLGGTIFQNILVSQLDGDLGSITASDVVEDALSTISDLRNLPDSPMKLTVMNGIANTLKVLWLYASIVGLVGFVLSFLIQGYSLDACPANDNHQRKKEKVAQETQSIFGV